MTSYLDMPDTALLVLVARRDGDALAELVRRYGTTVLVATGWTETGAADAERRTADVFLDVWRRPDAYAPGGGSTRSHLIRSALRGRDEPAVRRAAAQLAGLEGWTYHDVAEALVRPCRHVASLIREQLAALHADEGD